MGSIPEGVRIQHLIAFIRLGVEELGVRSAEIAVFNNRWRDEDQQVVLGHALGFAAESVSEVGYVTEQWHFGGGGLGIIADHAAHDQRMGIGNEDPGVKTAEIKQVGLIGQTTDSLTLNASEA